MDRQLIRLTSEVLTVVVAHDGAMPELVSVGPDLGGFEAAALDLPVPGGTLDQTAPVGIVAEHATGYPGRPGLVGGRPDGTAWSPRFRLFDVEVAADRARFDLRDDVAQLALTLELEVAGALTIRAELHNRGDDTYGIQRLAPTVPVPAHATELVTFGGRWCREFQTRRSDFDGLTVVENRRGRTSHQRLPAAFVGQSGFSEQQGEVWGVQLAWSGNFELSAEHLPDGRRVLQVGELLVPGEVDVAPGSSYAAPDVVVVWSPEGLNTASQRFHEEVRRNLPPTSSSPRPVVLNTWEAVYFDHRLDVLAELADRAAEVGVERFVLDDGWFGGRRDDSAGLGDWWVSDQVWPRGLDPIIEHVRGRGMDFGIWVEPEMVNPDSDLYRAHPDWTLTTAGYDPPLGRRQLVLDFGRPEVREHLFSAIDALLTRYDISYLKWDMNRDVVQGSHRGRPGTHGHVVGLYELLDRLRDAHPDIEIESCASGGGRTDLGILRRTDRLWTSDCNDALERQLIQRGCSMLFPPEVMGSHIGPDRAHTTGRRHDLSFRALTAIFGHLGIEWNLLAASPAELGLLARVIALHRRLRPLLHGGRVVRVDHPDPAALVHGVVAPDAAHAVFAYVQLTTSADMVPPPFRVPGLSPDAPYRVKVVDELSPSAGSARPAPTAGERPGPTWMDDAPIILSGAQLAMRGLQPPILDPETVLLLELAAD